MTFKTIEEANELLQTMAGKPEKIARIFKGCMVQIDDGPKFILTGELDTEGCAIGSDDDNAG